MVAEVSDAHDACALVRSRSSAGFHRKVLPMGYGKPSKSAEKHALLRPTKSRRRYSPAMLLPGRAGQSRHQSASIVSAPTDIPGGDTVADE
jgi:hypothetical protein